MWIVGIGGAVAEVVGRLLADMATKTQVLCVTHLPQVASQGQQHLRVAKSGNGKTVSSRLEVLDEGKPGRRSGAHARRPEAHRQYPRPRS